VVKVVIPGGPRPGMFEVVSQSPAPGTSVQLGTTVTLVVRAVEIDF